MEANDDAPMTKETVLKEDGRYLIYYHFESARTVPAAENQATEVK